MEKIHFYFANVIKNAKTMGGIVCIWCFVNHLLQVTVIWIIHDFHHIGYYEGAKQKTKRCPIHRLHAGSRWSSMLEKWVLERHKKYLPSSHPYQHNTIQFNGKVKWCPTFTWITLIETLEIQHLPQMVWNIDPFLWDSSLGN